MPVWHRYQYFQSKKDSLQILSKQHLTRIVVTKKKNQTKIRPMTVMTRAATPLLPQLMMSSTEPPHPQIQNQPMPIQQEQLQAVKGINLQAVKEINLQVVKGINLQVVKGINLQVVKGINLQVVKGINLQTVVRINLQTMERNNPQKTKQTIKSHQMHLHPLQKQKIKIPQHLGQALMLKIPKAATLRRMKIKLSSRTLLHQPRQKLMRLRKI